MYKKILVPLDGSQISETVLPYARSFAKALKLSIELLQVIDPESFRLPSKSPHGQDVMSEAETKNCSIAYLKSAAETFRNFGTVQYSVEVGSPAEVIVNRAAGDSGTLIAMGTHGRSGLQRWLLGSVAHKVANMANNAVLLVRAGEGMMTSGEVELKTALVFLDGSDLAEMALPHVTEVAKEMLLEIILVRVYDPLIYGHLPRMDQITKELKAEAEAYLEKKARQLEAADLEEVTYRALKGYPAAEIVDIIQKTPNSLTVITTRGRSGVKRWLLGSVTQHVISHANGPVLIVRAP